jgi:hypothetical protein
MERATTRSARSGLSALWLPGLLLIVGVPTLIFANVWLGLLLTLVGVGILAGFIPRRWERAGGVQVSLPDRPRQEPWTKSHEGR